MGKTVRVRIQLGLVCALVGTVRAGHKLIGVDTVTHTLIKIDTTTGAAAAIGPVGDDGVAGLAWDPNHGVLYGSSTATDNLLRIDPATGATAIVGPLGVSLMHGIAYDPGTNTLYGATGTSTAVTTSTLSLYTINVNTGHADLIGAHGIGGLGDIAFDPLNRIMYATEIFDAKSLYTLSVVTGASALIGPFGNTVGIGAGAAYEPSLGLFISNNHASSRPDDELYHVDTATGHASLIGDIGWGNVISLAFVPEEVIPEPAGASLIAVSAILLLCRRER